MSCNALSFIDEPEAGLTSLTWLVGAGAHKLAAICVEASAKSRVESWKRHHGHMFHMVITSFDTNWLGLPLLKDEKRSLHTGIKRNAKATEAKGPRKGRNQKTALPEFAVNEIIRRVALIHHVTPEQILSSTRTRPVARARAHAIFLLRKELALSQPQIAQLLGYKDHTTVRDVLTKTLDEILR